MLIFSFDSNNTVLVFSYKRKLGGKHRFSDDLFGEAVWRSVYPREKKTSVLQAAFDSTGEPCPG